MSYYQTLVRVALSVSPLFACLFVATEAQAIRVRHVFKETVSFGSELLNFDRFVGERFRLQLEYDLSMPSSGPLTLPTGQRAIYSSPAQPVGADPSLVEFIISPPTFELSIGGEFLDEYVVPDGPFDPALLAPPPLLELRDQSTLGGPLGPSSGPADEFLTLNGRLVLRDSSGGVFDEFLLLPEILDIADFDASFVQYIEVDPNDPSRAGGLNSGVDTITSTIVPEPNTAALLATGVACFAQVSAVRRRRLRQNR